MNKAIVITTINRKTECIRKYHSMKDWNLIIVGDRKSKHIRSAGNLVFLSVEDQKKLGYKTVKYCPYDHYSRKNIGYLYAMQMGSDVIYDTDDDNIPLANWGLRPFSSGNILRSKEKFVNIYRYFQKGRIWPRGFPLEDINQKNTCSEVKKGRPVNIAVWQGMADSDPDVDAIYRLVFNNVVKFKRRPSVALDKFHYCPFNSQNTFWNKTVFPFLYLPSTISFRFTDILRGYVAQRLFWELDHHLGFEGATVVQQRNAHSLLKDFIDEMPCYLHTKAIVEALDALSLRACPQSDLEKVYRMLVLKSHVPAGELNVLRAWLADVERCNR